MGLRLHGISIISQLLVWNLGRVLETLIFEEVAWPYHLWLKWKMEDASSLNCISTLWLVSLIKQQLWRAIFGVSEMWDRGVHENVDSRMADLYPAQDSIRKCYLYHCSGTWERVFLLWQHDPWSSSSLVLWFSTECLPCSAIGQRMSLCRQSYNMGKLTSPFKS